jgi:hypothetical protein
MAMMTFAAREFVDQRLREAAEGIERAQREAAAKKGYKNGGARDRSQVLVWLDWLPTAEIPNQWSTEFEPATHTSRSLRRNV